MKADVAGAPAVWLLPEPPDPAGCARKVLLVSAKKTLKVVSWKSSGDLRELGHCRR